MWIPPELALTNISFQSLRHLLSVFYMPIIALQPQGNVVKSQVPLGSEVLQSTHFQPSCSSTIEFPRYYMRYFLPTSLLHPTQTQINQFLPPNPILFVLFFISIPLFMYQSLSTCYVLDFKLGTHWIHSVERNRHISRPQGPSNVVRNVDITQITIHVIHYNISNSIIFLLTQVKNSSSALLLSTFTTNQ